MSPPPASSNAEALPLLEQEPSVGSGGATALVLGLCALLGLLAVWGQDHIRNNSADFEAGIYFPVTSAQHLAQLNPPRPVDPVWQNGKYLFSTSCSPCHMLDGQGQPGQFPPLAGSEWVMAANPNRIIRIVLSGFQGPVTVKGTEFNNVMVPWKDLMSDAQVAAVLTYVRQEWGNKAASVDPEQVKAIREKTKDRESSWTAEELLAVPETE